MNGQEARDLEADVTDKEIYDALYDIGNEKASSLDVLMLSFTRML